MQSDRLERIALAEAEIFELALSDPDILLDKYQVAALLRLGDPTSVRRSMPGALRILIDGRWCLRWQAGAVMEERKNRPCCWDEAPAFLPDPAVHAPDLVTPFHVLRDAIITQCARARELQAEVDAVLRRVA